jgi:uracil-DNA glycosylase
VRPLLVGEAPSASARTLDGPALSGRAGERLAGFAGLGGVEELLSAFETANLFDAYPGAAWPAERARRAATARPLAPVTVLLGRRVAAAYHLRTVNWCTWYFVGRRSAPVEVAVIPHPSGLTRNYNSPLARELAGRILREAVERAADR